VVIWKATTFDEVYKQLVPIGKLVGEQSDQGHEAATNLIKAYTMFYTKQEPCAEAILISRWNEYVEAENA